MRPGAPRLRQRGGRDAPRVGNPVNQAPPRALTPSEPAPFVLQTSLDDFYVSYQIKAYTEQPGMASKIYSQLHSNIQDGFNGAGIEIMSPHYRGNRDGSAITIPSEYSPSQTDGDESKNDIA